jgi:nucleotide-binding universal stress UspA family protein
MATRALSRSIQDYIEADVLLEWRQEMGGDVAEQVKRVDRARRRLQRELANGQPSDASLIQAAETYLNAHLADRIGGADQPDHRSVQRARRELLEKVGAASGPAVDGEVPRPIPLTSRVLIAIDASPPSEWAIDVGGGFARTLDAHVMVLHVVEPPGGDLVYATDEPAEQRRRDGTLMLERAQRALPSDVDSDQMLVEGDAGNEIVTAARVWEADLIVMGTRGRGRFAQLILGSTAEQVIREAPCPVLTVGRAPERFVGQVHHRADQKPDEAVLTRP